MRPLRVGARFVKGVGFALGGLFFGPIVLSLLFLFVAIGAGASDPDTGPRGNIVGGFIEIIRAGYTFPLYLPLGCALLGFLIGASFDPEKAEEEAKRLEQFRERLVKQAADDKAYKEREQARRDAREASRKNTNP